MASFYGTTLGKKAVMAATGIILWGWIVAHMAGNLKFFAGAESLNHYAEWLREMGRPLLPRTGLLWMVRAVLIVATVLHVHATVALTLINRRARPQGYAAWQPQSASFAARTMRWSGAGLLLFVVYHLLHMTLGWRGVHPDFVTGDVYHNLTVAFRSVLVTAVYLAAMLLLGLHLFHGLWSMFQSLGWSHPRYNPWRRAFATVFAILVAAGFALVPFLIASGLAG